MSLLNDLPLPVYVALCLFLIGAFVITIIKRYKKDRKGLIVLYITVTFGVILAVIGKIGSAINNQFEIFKNYIPIAVISTLVIIIFESVFMVLTHKGNEQSRKLAKIVLLLYSIAFIIFLILFFVNLQG